MLPQSLSRVYWQMNKKENQVTISQEQFDCLNADKNFLKNDITGDL